MDHDLTPVQVCEKLIGPPQTLSKIAKMTSKTAYNWRHPSNNRDAGDMPPRANRALLAYSDAHGLGLTADHLINGASVAEVASILDGRKATAA